MRFRDIEMDMVVRIIDFGGNSPSHWALGGEMHEWQGEKVTIVDFNDDEEVFIEEDEGKWQWFASDFEPCNPLRSDNPNIKYKQHKRDMQRMRWEDYKKKIDDESKNNVWSFKT